MTYRSQRSLLAGHFAATRQDLSLDAPRPYRGSVYFERPAPRVVALFRQHPQAVGGRSPIELIERVAAGLELTRLPLVPALFDAMHDALCALQASVEDQDEAFESAWSFGAHALALELMNETLAFCAAGNGRLYRLHGGRLQTVFGGQTIIASLASATDLDPTAVPADLEHIVLYALGVAGAQASWHGPERVDAQPGDRFLLTTYRTVEGMTTDELEGLLAEPDRDRAAEVVVAQARRKAAQADRHWFSAEAAVVDVAGG